MSYMLVDLNQVLISSIMMHLAREKKNMVEEDLLRHLCLNTLRANVKKFKKDYPNVVLCCDNRHYWRREVFPFYKFHRKDDRDKSGHDWNFIFGVLNKLRDELKQHFPYKVLDVHGAEADDIIAVMTPRLAANEKVLILSSDKDFGQLQKYANVKQFSPIMDKWIKIDDPQTFVNEHIIRGDRGDGIPNILSADDTFAAGGRQKPLNKTRLEEWVKQPASQFCTTDALLSRYKRNQMLIDFDQIPQSIQESIIRAYDETPVSSKQTLLNYLIEKGLTNLIGSVADF